MAKNDEEQVSALDQVTAAGNEAIDLINRVDDATAKFQPSKRRGSIIKSAQGNIFEFPVFVSNSVPLDYATATVSLLEQIYAAYLQMAISINPVVDAKTVKNGLQFANYKVNTNKYIEYTELDYQHEVCHNVIQEGDNQLEFELLSIEDSEARLINEAVDHQPLSEFDHFFQEAPDDLANAIDAARSAQQELTDFRTNNRIINANDPETETLGMTATQVPTDRFVTNNRERLLPLPIFHRDLANNRVELRGNGTGLYNNQNGQYQFVPESQLRQYFIDNNVRYANTTGNNAFNAYRVSVENSGHLLDSLSNQRRTELENNLDNANAEVRRIQNLGNERRAEADNRRQEIESIVDRIRYLGYKPTDSEYELIGGGNAEAGKAMYRTLRNGNIINNIDTGLGMASTLANTVNNATNAAYNISTFKDRKEAQKYQTEKLRREVEDYDKAQALKKTEVYGKMKTSNIQYVDDSKCVKMNTMKPLLMKVTLSMLNKDDSIQPIEYVIGVKTHTRVVPASILPEVAKYPLKEMDKISRKIKWRAGELKFLKDLVFRIDEKKQTAADSRDPNRKWYRRLYELAHMKGDAPATAVVQGKSIFKTFIKDKQGKSKLMHGFIPNAAIIMSQTDVNNIKQTTDIDLLKSSSAKKFCGELFLMNLVIIDTDAESIKIMQPDSNNEFDVHSLASVNKQLAQLDTAGTKTRDMFKLLG